ncbi:hypothetical protein MKX01_024638 [Papaver californicum]|nr:hypothetical protein MKX01_024638 [Papaver californicum]
MEAETTSSSSRSGSNSSSGADSYIGSLISLTSKFEIRYEGVLYNINTEESSIGLRNVKSFGTEGRKKDGPQVPSNDKVYEYILFRGSDIKDLQVKSSPPVQTTAPIQNDPAIIQSHYSRPPPVSPSFPPAGSGSIPDLTPHPSQMGQPRPTFQGGLPLYQPGGSLGSWGSAPPPPTGNGSGLAMPMYWQGFYGPTNGLPPMQQQSLFRPPPGLSLPHSMQHSGVNPSLPNVPSNLVPSNLPPSSNPVSSVPEMPSSLLAPVSSSSLSSTSSSLTPTFPSNLVNSHSAASASDTFPVLMPNRAPPTAVHTAALSSSSSLVSPLTISTLGKNVTVSPISSKPKTVASGSSMGHQTLPQSVSPIVGTSSSSHKEPSVPSLVTPGQLLQPSSAAGLSSSHSSPPTRKDVKEVQAPLLSERPATPPKELQAPLLPLPSSSGQKPNGSATQTRNNYHNNYHYRGRERGRGNGFSRPITKFTEDFDFMAMNEKFKKDEVWGHLGKSSKAQSGDEEDNDGDYLNDEEDDGRVEAAPVYVKDDFFDSLSCNGFDRGSRGGRTKFSEQIKIDTETFGDFPRHRGGRGRGPGRGGRSRGPHYGRGYGYVGRGRGQG